MPGECPDKHGCSKGTESHGHHTSPKVIFVSLLADVYNTAICPTSLIAFGLGYFFLRLPDSSFVYTDGFGNISDKLHILSDTILADTLEPGC